MLIRGFGSEGTQPASVVIVCNFTSWVIYICIQSLEKPSESVITSLMRVSSWNRAKMETDCKNLILLHCLAFHSAYVRILSFPEHDISAVAQRQEKVNKSKYKSMSLVLAVVPGGESRLEWLGIMVQVCFTEGEESGSPSTFSIGLFKKQSVFANTLHCSSRLPLHHVLWSALQLVLAPANILTDWHPVHEMQIWQFYSAQCPLMLIPFDAIRVFKRLKKRCMKSKQSQLAKAIVSCVRVVKLVAIVNIILWQYFLKSDDYIETKNLAVSYNMTCDWLLISFPAALFECTLQRFKWSFNPVQLLRRVEVCHL